MYCFHGWIDENVKPKTSAVQNFVTAPILPNIHLRPSQVFVVLIGGGPAVSNLNNNSGLLLTLLRLCLHTSEKSPNIILLLFSGLVLQMVIYFSLHFQIMLDNLLHL